MKIFIEHEVSDDPIFCKQCLHKEEDFCNVFNVFLKNSYSDRIKCNRCISAAKKAPLCNSTSKVYQCTCK